MREQIAEEKALEQSIQDDDPCLQHVRTILDAGYKPGGGSWEGQKARAAALRTLMEKVAQAAIDASAGVCSHWAERYAAASDEAKTAKKRVETRDFETMGMTCRFREADIRALSPKSIVEGVK